MLATTRSVAPSWASHTRCYPYNPHAPKVRFPLQHLSKTLLFTTQTNGLAVLQHVESNGIARDRKLATLGFAPLQYNPVRQQLIICRQAVVRLHFIGTNEEATRQMKQRYHSPAFSLGAETLNQLTEKSTFEVAPIRYLIVAHHSFRNQLDTFVHWKQRKGFLTDIVYTDDPAVGNTSTSIAQYVKSQYTQATSERPAPTYLLLVGDVEQIPSFQGNSLMTNHVTDLYYATWTPGDNLPDCHYGRFFPLKMRHS